MMLVINWSMQYSVLGKSFILLELGQPLIHALYKFGQKAQGPGSVVRANVITILMVLFTPSGTLIRSYNCIFVLTRCRRRRNKGLIN